DSGATEFRSSQTRTRGAACTALKGEVRRGRLAQRRELDLEAGDLPLRLAHACGDAGVDRRASLSSAALSREAERAELALESEDLRAGSVGRTREVLLERRGSFRRT